MTNEHPTIYLLPGMSPDIPVFAKLASRLPQSQYIEYIDPLPDESINAYAMRLANQMIPNSYLVGISFGAILAQEIAKHIEPHGCVVISSVRRPSQLPPWFRVGRRLRTNQVTALLRSIGRLATVIPSRLATGSTTRVRKLAGDQGYWYRWATAAVLAWNPSTPRCRLLHIHGDADTTFPIRYVDPDVCVRGGKHSLTVSHPQEVADAIVQFMKSA